MAELYFHSPFLEFLDHIFIFQFSLCYIELKMSSCLSSPPSSNISQNWKLDLLHTSSKKETSALQTQHGRLSLTCKGGGGGRMFPGWTEMGARSCLSAQGTMLFRITHWLTDCIWLAGMFCLACTCLEASNIKDTSAAKSKWRACRGLADCPPLPPRGSLSYQSLWLPRCVG